MYNVSGVIDTHFLWNNIYQNISGKRLGGKRDFEIFWYTLFRYFKGSVPITRCTRVQNAFKAEIIFRSLFRTFLTWIIVNIEFHPDEYELAILYSSSVISRTKFFEPCETRRARDYVLNASNFIVLVDDDARSPSEIPNDITK